MAITSGFFNSIDGDRTYNARDMSMYFKGLISDGVYENVDGKFRVTAGEGMTVNVASGRAIIDCQWVNNDATETLTLDPPTVGVTRNDFIVLRLDMSESGRKISLAVKKGSSTNDRVWTETVKELYLAYVVVLPTDTAVSAARVIDLRGSNLCPFVTGLINQVDTAELFAQYQASCEQYAKQLENYIAEQQQAFNAWFSSLTETLHVDASIVKYQRSWVENPRSGYTEQVTMGIREYEAGDVVFLHFGGVLLVEGTEFTISGTGEDAIITFPNAVLSPNPPSDGIPITVIVIKAVIGGGVVSNKIDEINGEVV